MVKFSDIYVSKFNPTVLQLDFLVDRFFVLPGQDLNSHHCYTEAPIAGVKKSTGPGTAICRFRPCIF